LGSDSLRERDTPLARCESGFGALQGGLAKARTSRRRSTPRGNSPLTYSRHALILPGVITSFADRRTKDLFGLERVKGLSAEIQRAALRKLLIIDAAASIDDLRVPPGNRLEALRGDLRGFHSIRVND